MSALYTGSFTRFGKHLRPAQTVSEAVSNPKEVLHVCFVRADSRRLVIIEDSFESREETAAEVRADSQCGRQEVIGESVETRIEGQIVIEFRVLRSQSILLQKLLLAVSP